MDTITIGYFRCRCGSEWTAVSLRKCWKGRKLLNRKKAYSGRHNKENSHHQQEMKKRRSQFQYLFRFFAPVDHLRRNYYINKAIMITLIRIKEEIYGGFQEVRRPNMT